MNFDCVPQLLKQQASKNSSIGEVPYLIRVKENFLT
jgi:hypothetical protein